jgi:hypothetical protein
MSERKKIRDRYSQLSEYSNANLFISNNANPFLVSPYTPINTAQFAKKSVTEDIQQQISSIIGSFSSIINPVDYSIKLSTIYPATATSTVTVHGSLIIEEDLTVNNTLNILTLSTTNITTDLLTIQKGYFSTLLGSTIQTNTNTFGSGYFSTLLGSTIQTNTNTFQSGYFSTLLGSTIQTNTNTFGSGYFSTLLGSTIQTNTNTFGSGYFSTLLGSTIQTNTINNTISIGTQELTYSSLFTPNIYAAPAVTTILSSIKINIGGIMYKIALYQDS